MKLTILISALLGTLAVSAGLALYLWYQLDDVDMGFHGMAALFLGVFFTLAMGMGLMFLVFYSSRKGHDDAAGGPRDSRGDPEP